MRSKNTPQGGFTLIELMIVVAILAILMAIVIPGLLRARLAANETSAIGTIKTLSSSQEQFRSAAIVDTDGNGAGEYGYFQELGGAGVYRTAACGLSTVPTAPPFITSVLGTSCLTSAIGTANKSGYLFQIWLPDVNGAALGIPETPGAPPCDVLRANQQEQRWVVYGWPAALRTSGNSCFFGSHANELFFAQNVNGSNYDGEGNPVGDGNAALSLTAVNLDGSPPATGVSQDGQNWSPVQ